MSYKGQHHAPASGHGKRRSSSSSNVGKHDKRYVEAQYSALIAHDQDTGTIPRVGPAAVADVEPEAGGTESVARSTATMSMATLLSRGTGFLRTWAMAFALGNTVITSAYQVANDMPNMVFELVAGGLLSTAFLPIYLKQRQRGEKEANAFGSNLLNICFIALGVITLLATIFSSQVMYTQTFMTGGEDQELATFFFRFFAIQIIFYGAGGIISGILNAQRRFIWPALGPVFNNIVVIITMFGYVPLSSWDQQFALVWLAVGTSVGVLAQMGVQIPALIRSGFHWSPRINLHDPALREAVHLAVPAIIFTVTNLICVSVMNAFALGVSDNGPSSLYYARLWYQLPYGVLAVALSTAMFTEMSESVARENMVAFRDNVKTGLRGTFFLIIPMATLLVIMAPLLITLYHAGQFTADDIATVARILVFWGICLPFYSAYLYLYFAFSAIRKLKVVTVVNTVASVVQVFLYAFLTTYVPFEGGSGLGLIGIPIADIIFYAIMFVVLFALLHREVGTFGGGEVVFTAFKVLAASAVGGVLGYLLYSVLPSTSGILMALLEIVVIAVVTLAVIYALCALMRIPEMRLLSSMRDKLVRRLRPRRG